MADILYTTTHQVVSVLGATGADVDEEQVMRMDLETDVRTEFYEWIPNHADVYAWFQGSGATDTQKHMADLLVLCCKYYTAYLLSRSMSASVPRSMENAGIQTMERQMDWRAVSDAMRGAYVQYKGKLVDLLAAVDYVLPRTVGISAHRQRYDPGRTDFPAVPLESPLFVHWP